MKNIPVCVRSGLRQSGCAVLCALMILAVTSPSGGTEVSSPPQAVDFENDPIHQAAMEASRNNKIVFVLGEGFDELSMDALTEDLGAIGLLKDKHYGIMVNPSMQREKGLIYIGGQISKFESSGLPFIFSQDETESAVFAIKSLIKSGQIIVAR